MKKIIKYNDKCVKKMCNLITKTVETKPISFNEEWERRIKLIRKGI